MLTPAEQARLHAECTVAHAVKCGHALSRFWIGRAFLLAVLLLCVAILTSCANLPRIKTGSAEVRGPANAGSPATLHTVTAGTTVALPTGSTITVTKRAALAARLASPQSPAQAAQPAEEVTVIHPAGPSEYRKTEADSQASTGTIDTSVAKHQIDVAERRWLLWAGLGCGIAGLVLRSMLPSWPGLSNGLLLAAPLALAAWKFAEVPAWIWLLVIGLVSAMALGYKRAQWDKNGDGIPDALQPK